MYATTSSKKKLDCTEQPLRHLKYIYKVTSQLTDQSNSTFGVVLVKIIASYMSVCAKKQCDTSRDVDMWSFFFFFSLEEESDMC